MSETRRAVLSLLLVGVLATSGCIGFITGDKALQASSAQVTVEDSTVEEQGYTEKTVEPMVIKRDFEVAGQTRTVNVTNHIAEYSRTAEIPLLGSDQEVARFIAFSSPQVSIAGQALNPIASWSNKRLLEQVQSAYSGIKNIERVDSYTVESLGEARNVTKFSADATFNGQEVPVYIHVTKFKHDGAKKDVVAGIGVYPQRLDEDSPTEQSRVKALIQGLEH